MNNDNIFKIHIKAIAQILCVWALLALSYFLISYFIYD